MSRVDHVRNRTIVTECSLPPIPSKNYDWKAYRLDWDDGEPIGFGSTESEAINDLLELEEERGITCEYLEFRKV